MDVYVVTQTQTQRRPSFSPLSWFCILVSKQPLASNCGSAVGWTLPTSLRPEPPPPIPTPTSPPIPETAASSHPPTTIPKMYFLYPPPFFFSLYILKFLASHSYSLLQILSKAKLIALPFLLLWFLLKWKLPELDTLLKWSTVCVFCSILVACFVLFFFFIGVEIARSCYT